MGPIFPLPLLFLHLLTASGVKIKGHHNNSDYVYVGVAGVNAVTGYPLGPSEEIFLEIDQIQSVYIYASPNGTACYIGS